MSSDNEKNESGFHVPRWLLWIIGAIISAGMLMMFTRQVTFGKFGVLPILYEMRSAGDLGGYLSLGFVLLIQVALISEGIRCLLKRQFLLGLILLAVSVCLDLPLFEV